MRRAGVFGNDLEMDTAVAGIFRRTVDALIAEHSQILDTPLDGTNTDAHGSSGFTHSAAVAQQPQYLAVLAGRNRPLSFCRQ